MSNRDLDRKTEVYKRWRSEVIKRDKHTCQMPGCDTNKGRIQVHHIQRWSDAPQLRYTVDNGISLCWNCHKKVTKKEAFFAPLFTLIVQRNKKK